jgi:hypothetical protein
VIFLYTHPLTLRKVHKLESGILFVLIYREQLKEKLNAAGIPMALYPMPLNRQPAVADAHVIIC